MKAKLLFLAALLVVAFGVAYAWDDDDDTTMRFGPWMEPDLVPEVNSPDFMDSCVSISKDGLSLYFASNRPKGEGSRDLYVSERASTKKTWGTPRKLKILNTQYWDSCPALSLDEQQLYFASNRLGGCGGSDIYVSWRKDKRKNFGETGWGLPVNLGCEVDDYVNSASWEITPALFRDESDAVIMYFARGGDIFESRMRDDDKDDAPRPPDFGPGIPVHKLNSDDNEHGAIVRRDGLEVIFSTSRPGGKGDMDLWTATRKSTFHKWSKPEHIEGLINSEFFEGGRMTLSFDGRELYFRRGRTGDPGNGDLWVARRKKLGDPD